MRKLSLVLFLFACGDDGARHTPDARPGDGAPPADAAPDPVTIAAIVGGQPVAGVHVYFQNADSSVVLATTTDATGTASAVMAAGGYVTAINPYGAQGADELDTFAGVKPGDHLVLSQRVDTTITVNITAPSDPNMTSYIVTSPCDPEGNSLSPPAVLPVGGSLPLTSCGSATDFLVTASNGSATDYLYAANVAIADQANVDLTAGIYKPMLTRTLTYTNLPTAQSLSIEDDTVDPPHGIIYRTGNETPSDQPAATVDVPAFAGATDILQTTFNDVTFSHQVLIDYGALGSAFTTDVGSRALNNLAGYVSFDQATHAGSSTLDTSAGVAGDFSLVSLTISRPNPDKQWFWNIAAPFGASVPLPRLPTDVFDYNAGSADVGSVSRWINGKVPGGYDAVRALIFSTNSPADLAVGASGSATFLVSQPPLAIAPHVLRHRTR